MAEALDVINAGTTRLSIFTSFALRAFAPICGKQWKTGINWSCLNTCKNHIGKSRGKIFTHTDPILNAKVRISVRLGLGFRFRVRVRVKGRVRVGLVFRVRVQNTGQLKNILEKIIQTIFVQINDNVSLLFTVIIEINHYSFPIIFSTCLSLSPNNRLSLCWGVVKHSFIHSFIHNHLKFINWACLRYTVIFIHSFIHSFIHNHLKFINWACLRYTVIHLIIQNNEFLNYIL